MYTLRIEVQPLPREERLETRENLLSNFSRYEQNVLSSMALDQDHVRQQWIDAIVENRYPPQRINDYFQGKLDLMNDQRLMDIACCPRIEHIMPPPMDFDREATKAWGRGLSVQQERQMFDAFGY
jgi:hypothetical protein